jgi:hypothetical protein
MYFPIVISICFVMGVASSELKAQSEFKVKSYEIITGGHTVSLEPTFGKIQQKSTGAARMLVGSFKSKQFVLIPGKSASARIAHEDPQQFSFTLSYSVPQGLQADTLVAMVNLRPLAIDKDNNRLYVLNDTHVNVIGGKSDTPGGIFGIHVNITRVVDSKVQFEPIERLQPGEYAFVIQDVSPYGEITMRMYCFGVD